MQQVIITTACDACLRRAWRLHAAAVTPTHAHVLVSWQHGDWKPTSDTLKRIIGYALGRRVGPPGSRWLSRGQSRKRVTDRAHLDYLLSSYLPKHVKEGGTLWREGDSVGGLPPAAT